MRKLAVAIVAVIVLAFVGVTFADMGAEKTDVLTSARWPWIPPMIPVGWAIFNTTPNDDLIVQMHVEAFEPNWTFNVWLMNKLHREIYWGALTTNEAGNGNCHLVGTVPRYMIDDPDAETVWIRVQLRDAASNRRWYRTLEGYEIPVK